MGSRLVHISDTSHQHWHHDHPGDGGLLARLARRMILCGEANSVQLFIPCFREFHSQFLVINCISFTAKSPVDITAFTKRFSVHCYTKLQQHVWEVGRWWELVCGRLVRRDCECGDGGSMGLQWPPALMLHHQQHVDLSPPISQASVHTVTRVCQFIQSWFFVRVQQTVCLFTPENLTTTLQSKLCHCLAICALLGLKKQATVSHQNIECHAETPVLAASDIIHEASD